MNKNILLMVDVVSNEKGVEKELTFDALEAALASAAKEQYGDESELRVAIDRETGEYETFRRRSEEHTSELQSLMRISYAVFCLKKQNKQHIHDSTTTTSQ